MSDTFHYEGFSNPNGTIVPDDVFDVLMPQLTDPELRVLLYIIRRTFGFKRDHDDISLKQMVDGITTRDGRVLDRGTGISKASVARGLKGLSEKGIITVRHNSSAKRGNEPTTYALRFRDAPSTVAQPVSQTGTPPLSQSETPPLSQIETPPNTSPKVPPLSQIETSPCLTGETTLVSPVRHTTNSRQQTAEQKTAPEVSKLRIEPPADFFVDNSEVQPHATQSTVVVAQSAHHAEDREGDVPGGATEERETGTATRDRLLIFVQDIGREFNDGASVRSSTTRMANLYRKSNLSLDEFVAHLYRARATTRERTAAIRTPMDGDTSGWRKNKMGYFFSVLQNQLRLLE